jgi:hypothetical protein
MTGATWYYFTDQAHATAAAAEITAGGCLCQAGSVYDDTTAAPSIGHRDDEERRWVLVVADHDDGEDCPGGCYLIAEHHGGEFDTHESGPYLIPPDTQAALAMDFEQP